nr:hypothetical protein [Tanacetum cinerariifolium]
QRGRVEHSHASYVLRDIHKQPPDSGHGRNQHIAHLLSGDTWQPTDPLTQPLTRPLTGDQPPLIGIPVVVLRWSGSGPVVVHSGPHRLPELLVKSLTPELLKLLNAHDFSSSIPTKLKELPSKFNEIMGEVIDLKKYVSKLKNLKLELPAGLLALPEFATTIQVASHKTSDQRVPSAGQAGTHPTEGKKNTQQITITRLFQRRTKKDVAKANMYKETIIPTKAPETTVIPPTIATTTTIIIPTTLPFQSPFLPSPPKTTPNLIGRKLKETRAIKFCLMRKLMKKSLKVTLKLKSD